MRLRCHPLKRFGRAGKVVQPRHHRRILDRHAQGAVQPLNDRPRRAARRVHAVPDRDLEAGQPRLGGGGDVGGLRQTFARGDRQATNAAVAHERQGGGGLVAVDVDVAGDQLREDRAGAGEGDGGEIDAQLRLQQRAA